MVPSDWSMKPAAVPPGGKFRLIFLTHTLRTAESAAISSYNTTVQNDVTSRNATLAPYANQFRALVSTSTVNARDNVQMTGAGTGIKVYWAGGKKVADDYTDFWDGSWDNEAYTDLLRSDGSAVPANQHHRRPFTGTSKGGNKGFDAHAGTTIHAHNGVIAGSPGPESGGPIDGAAVQVKTFSHTIYGVSPLFEVGTKTIVESLSFTKDDYLAYENAGTVKITVKLASALSTSTTVRISSANNTATASTDEKEGDYEGFENVDLTIPAGSLTASHTIQINNDSQYENGDGLEGEDFHVSVVSVNGDTSLGGAETEVTIVDDEYTACFDSKTFLVGESAGVYSLGIRLSRALPFSVTATHAVVDYLSTVGVDYEVLKGTHTFKPGQQDGAFEIWIKDDKDNENNELFRVTALVPAVPDGEVFCSTDIIIQDDDGVVDSQRRTVSLTDQGARKGQDIIEGADGALGLSHFAGPKFSAGVTTPNGADYSVKVCVTSTTATRSADNTHSAGEDFVAQGVSGGTARANGCSVTSLATSLSNPAEHEFAMLQLRAFGDTVHEEPETITVTLEIVDNPDKRLKLGTSTLTYTIRDNSDFLNGLPVYTVTGGDSPVTEGALAKFLVTADRSVSAFATLRYTVSQTGDVLREGELGGKTTGILGVGTVLVRTDDDGVYEPDGGQVKVTLNPGTGYRVGEQSSAVVKVNDDSDAYSVDCNPLRASVSTEKLTIRENNKNVRMINYPENGKYNCPLPGINVFGTMNIPLPRGVSGNFQFSPAPDPDFVYIEPGWNNDRFDGTLCGEVFNRGGHKWQLCVIDDDRAPPATTEFRLLDGGRSITLNEGQEATHKVVIGKPAAQALPCFEWTAPSAVRDVFFDMGKALDSNGCMKSWPGTPHVGYVIMDLYINTNDDDVVGPDPRFNIGLKSTRKDGSAEPGATAQSIGVTVVNDDHSEVVMVRPHPAPMTWVEVKEFFDNLSATAEDRKFSDGTFCDADTPGTRTVTAPGGSGVTRTCVKYFARHATHLKWSTGRATPFSYILRAWAPGEGGGRNFATIAANTGYSAGKWTLDQTAFACNSPEQRAREVTISVREAADWSNELSSPALAPGSTKFPVCAHEMPGRDYTYTDESSLPQGMRSEPPKDVDEYPATEGAYAELPRAEIIIAESTPYVDIRNARETKLVKEGRRARFFVELSGEAARDVSVKWRVRPSVERPRATLGEDVEKASGTLVIAQGETRGEIRVKTYEDSHDDDGEKFRVRLVSAEGADIRQQRAHAIIRNDDPMPKAWLKDYGLAVAEQTLDGVVRRAASFRAASPGVRVAPGATPVEGHTIGGVGELLDGASAEATSEAGWSAWARTARTSFEDEEDGLAWDGEAVVVQGGVDKVNGDWLFGTAFGYSRGDGAYHRRDAADEPAYAMLSDITYIAPYAAYDAARGRTAYATAAVGHGAVTLTPHGRSAMAAPVDWWMVGAGAAQSVYEWGAFGASLTGDALYTGIRSGGSSELRATRSHSTAAGAGMEVSAQRGPLSGALNAQWRWDDEEEAFLEYGAGASVASGGFQASIDMAVSEHSETYGLGMSWDSRAFGTPSLSLDAQGNYSVGWTSGVWTVTHSGDSVRASMNAQF